MTLDKSKKYEFAGDVYSWIRDLAWNTVPGKFGWSNCEFQFLANKGLVKEIREPIVVNGVVSFDACGALVCDNRGGDVAIWWRALPLESRQGRTFRVSWTEVVE